jgi:hypothetical protein
MDKDEVWDIYFKKLHRLISSKRKTIEGIIQALAREELILRWNETGEEAAKAYFEAAASFIDERLYSYSMSHIDRFLKSASLGIGQGELAAAEREIDWYDWRDEKSEIDKKIESGLNLLLEGGEIADGLLDEFGAFPDSTIIKAYKRTPVKNHIPDYILASALEHVIKAR